ncbi:MAG: ATP-binding protein [Thermodesulfovibrionia bacterium]|nr:ATP-binding protein [Thermodesulfovibrionia bacterium]
MRLIKIFDSIAFRISFSIAVIVASTAVAVGWIIMREERKMLELELRSKGKYLTEIMSRRLVEPILYEERYEIFSLLQASMKGKESLVVYGEVYDKNGEVVVTAYKDEKLHKIIPLFENSIGSVDVREDNLLYHITLPINVEALGTIGFLRLGITKEPLYTTLKTVKQKFYLLSGGIIFIGIMIGLWMARKILRPILILNKGVRMVGEGELGIEVPVVGEGEIKELALSFNRMSKKLKELINETRAAQENLVRTEKLYAVGEFSAGVAHEIKNPLTSIKMLIQTVKQKKQALSSKDIEILEEEINRIDRIVKDFLAFARHEKTEKADVNINNLLEEVIAITRPKMEQSAISIKQKFSQPLPIIKGSHDALKQAFLNIVLNAIQAMDSGGGTLEIVTSYESGVMSQGLGNMPHNTPKVSVIIKDTGIGIPEKNLKKIFDPFFTTKEDGTGMGLALTYNIINDHSGRIDIDSTPFMGTTVRVELPL